MYLIYQSTDPVNGAIEQWTCRSDTESWGVPYSRQMDRSSTFLRCTPEDLAANTTLRQHHFMKDAGDCTLQDLKNGFLKRGIAWLRDAVFPGDVG